MTKKILALLLCAAVLCLAGCGSQENTPTTAATTAPTQATEATQAPTPAPTTEPFVVDLQGAYDACLAKMPDMIGLDADMMLNYCGIQAADCVEAYVAICADGLRTDEIWIIQATDVEALNRILDLAAARITAKAEESQTYSPEQYAVVQKAQTLQMGDYMALVVSPDVMELAAIVSSALGN